MNEKPTPPGDYECCESGCSPCVWDIYQEKLREWETQQKQDDQNLVSDISEYE